MVAGARALEERELVAIEGEVDRVYLDVKTPEIRVDDGTGGGYIVRKTGVKDTGRRVIFLSFEIISTVVMECEWLTPFF